MKTNTPELQQNPDGSVTVEAESADAALGAVHAELGVDAKVLAATRESRGGVGGFFKREVFVVHAQRSAEAPLRRPVPPDSASYGTQVGSTDIRSLGGSSVVPENAASGDPGSQVGLSEILKRVENDADGTDVAFGAVLRREIAESGMTPESLVRSNSAPLEESVIDLSDDTGPSLAEREAAAVEARRRRSVRRQEQARIRAEKKQPAESEADMAASAEVESVVSWSASSETIEASPPEGSLTPALDEPASAPDAHKVVSTSSTSSTRVRSGSVSTATVRPWTPPVPISRSQVVSGGERLGMPAGSASGAGAADWSLDRLAGMGLPFSFVQDLVGIDSDDDLAWISAVAARFEPYCRTLPLRESVFIGPRAAKLAPLLKIPSVMFPDDPPFGGSVCLRMDDEGAHRAWLKRVQGDRAVQLVMGGRRWTDLLSSDLSAVSYVGGPELLIPALQLCMKRDITLGYAVTPMGAMRLTPLDAALQVRFLLGRR